jgi:hypothetical protein
MMNGKVFGRTRPCLYRGIDPMFTWRIWGKYENFSLKAVFPTGIRSRHLPNIISEPYRHTNLLGDCISVGCEQRYITVWRRISEFAANILLAFFLTTLQNYFDLQSHIFFYGARAPPPPLVARASSVTRFLDRTQLDNHTVGRTPLDKWSARRRGHYLHNTQQTKQTNIHILSGIKPTIPLI